MSDNTHDELCDQYDTRCRRVQKIEPPRHPKQIETRISKGYAVLLVAAMVSGCVISKWFPGSWV